MNLERAKARRWEYKMKNYSVYFANYTIGVDAYENISEVCTLFGSKILLLGGQQALHAGKEKLEQSLRGNLTLIDVVTPSKECTYNEMQKWATHAKQLGVDMIFGMGGGKVLDIAKGVAEQAGLPVFTFPTIAATCAATTALSVVYKEDGNFDSFYFFEKPARHAFIDISIIASAPWKYLQAGMGDTMGKFFECHFSSRGDELAHSSALGREISNLCYLPLLKYGEQALHDCKEQTVSHSLTQVILANIVSTGMVSLLVLDEYNCALAHSIYYALVLLPGFEERYLHGNVVAYGVLVQLAVDQDMERLKEVKAFLEKLDIPSTLRQMQIDLDQTDLRDVLHEAVTGPDMEHIPYKITEHMVFNAMKIVENLDSKEI